MIGTMDRIGSVLGQDQDNFAIVPMNTYLRKRGTRSSITIQVKTADGPAFENAQDEARLVLRTRRHIRPGADEDFFIGTKESYMSLWRSISSAFFAVFIMVSVDLGCGGRHRHHERHAGQRDRPAREIGVRRAVGATQQDIVRQFIAESVTSVW